MNRRISIDLSKKITHVSALMTLFVVYIHYSSSCNNFSGANNAWWLAMVDYFGQGITRNAVPLFFVISGILAFWNVRTENGQKMLVNGAIKRLRTLGIPYVVWNCAATMFYIVLKWYNTKTMPLEPGTFFINCVFNNYYNGPLWYLQKLLIYSWIAPALYFIIRKHVGVFVILVLLMIQYLFMYDLLPGFVFYVIGACTALHMKERINHPQNKLVAVTSLVMFAITQVWRVLIFDVSIPIDVARTTVSYRLIEFLGSIALWFAADLIPFKNIPVLHLEKENFAVYVTHYMTVSLVTSTAVNKHLQMPTNSQAYAVFMLFVTPVAIYMVTALVAGLIKKCIPNTYRVVMGGR